MPLILSPPPAGDSGGLFDWLTTIGTWVAGLATVAAVVVALRLARREQANRLQVADNQALAQARLVRVSYPDWGAGNFDKGHPGYAHFEDRGPADGSRCYFAVPILNISDRPILDLRLRLWVSDLAKDPIESERVDVLPTAKTAQVVVTSSYPAISGRTPIALRVLWGDADGRRFCRDILAREDSPAPPQFYTGQPPVRFQ